MSINDRFAIVRYTLWACVAWSVVVGASLYWNYHHEHEFTLALARNEAVANINKDITFRRWATGHGGVYVPPQDDTPPNPYLVVPRRDVVTTDGQALTLMNPAYMVRQMHQLYSESFGVKGHITSLKPLNPSNAPDAWEATVLNGFDRGEVEIVFAIADLDGKPYMRAMQPMVTEAGCLKCHAHQGYQLGDIRGGISASVALGPYLEREDRVLRAMLGSHGGIWSASAYWRSSACSAGPLRGFRNASRPSGKFTISMKAWTGACANVPANSSVPTARWSRFPTRCPTICGRRCGP